MTFAVTKLSDFLEWYQAESEATGKVVDRLTDESLSQQVTDGHRTLGRVAWHIVTTYPEMLGQMELKVDSPSEQDPVPKSAAEVKAAYRRAARSLIEQLQTSWSDDTLRQEQEMYGINWPKARWLRTFITHEIHHRGQMTVLMRQANLTVPGVYGPAKEEWRDFGMEEPPV
jgi:uncharacterized damage-inducible protein DinB